MHNNRALYTGALKIVRPADASATATPKKISTTRLFRIPSFLRSAADTWVECGAERTTCASLKFAASIAFVRDGDNGLETLLTYRRGESPLGTVAFPGGLTLPEDSNPIPWIGPSAEEWRQRFKLEDPTQAHSVVVTAVREAFEETGLLLAGTDETNTVETSEGIDSMSARIAVSSGEKSLADYLSKRGLKIRADLLRPVGRWQSPDFRHKRYDAHFFATVAPVGQNATLHEEKGIWGKWVNVQEILDAKDSTELGDSIGQPDTVGKTLEDLVTPGVLTILEAMAASTTSIAFLAKKRNIEVKKAEVIKKDGEWMLTYTTPTEPKAREKCA